MFKAKRVALNYETDGIRAINRTFGDGWFETCSKWSEILALPLNEQIQKVRDTSIYGQTSAFRERNNLRILHSHIFPRYPFVNIRIASIGCASGQELYSILLQEWSKRNRIILHGFDSNQELLNTARKGEFFYEPQGCDIPRGVRGKGYTLDYVHGTDPTVTMTDEAKASVLFQYHNILDGPLNETYDIIFCQNVLYHYATEGRDIVLNNIRKSLSSKGWLLLESYDGLGGTGELPYTSWLSSLSQLGFRKEKIGLQWDPSDFYTRVYSRLP